MTVNLEGQVTNKRDTFRDSGTDLFCFLSVRLVGIALTLFPRPHRPAGAERSDVPTHRQTNAAKPNVTPPYWMLTLCISAEI